ncbi:hypothetical protein EIN_430680 [Entamoeba invadens IP1]|uniref:Kinetochore protein SPC25 n=1 Tax=Entamoeba invadens IP1 TaxID=370355 RepID=A0A0A1UHG1_ENTIV|nr:hypothetical protein EIN_430680 [Entamoeba invadens IP1]ELP95262.1 hypothetical protein EIN_430680 [Entamoeba invadens IP1]|eukprot:XP_004262033.1 hypothetical protein EIN_430680 [Entamoeba invadens IP1]
MSMTTSRIEGLPECLEEDDVHFLESVTSRYKEHNEEMRSSKDIFQTKIDTFPQRTGINLQRKEYVPRKTMIEKTDAELRQQIEDDLRLKIEFEEKKIAMLNEEMGYMQTQIGVYEKEIEKKSMIIENEERKKEENTNLLGQFGIEIEVTCEKNTTLLKVSFDKLGDIPQGQIELKIISGIFIVNKCSPKVLDIERYLSKLYQHHNFLKFLLQVRYAFPKTN